MNDRARREGVAVNRLQKQLAFERFLARLVHEGDQRWVLKGGYAIYPLEDHFAEKLHAYTTPREQPTRVKDLVDMLLLIELGLRPTSLLRLSIEATFERYARHPRPDRLPEPPKAWRAPFAQLAADVALPTHDLEKAHAQLEAFFESLAAKATGPGRG